MILYPNKCIKNGNILSQKSIYTLNLPFLQALLANTVRACVVTAEQGDDWNSSNCGFAFCCTQSWGRRAGGYTLSSQAGRGQVLCWLPPPPSHSLWDPGLQWGTLSSRRLNCDPELSLTSYSCCVTHVVTAIRKVINKAVWHCFLLLIIFMVL